MSFESVRKKHDQAAQALPLVLRAGDELINDDLRRDGYENRGWFLDLVGKY